MSNEKNNSNLHPIFEQIADAINPNKKPFNRLIEEDLKEPVNQLKQWDNNPLAKAAYDAYKDDVIAGNVSLTPESELGYIEGFLSGAKYGVQRANEIHKEVFAPTLERYNTGINDKGNMEAIN